MKTTIYASELRAADLCKCKDWSRPIICGVMVEAKAGVTSIASTDSYHMAVMENSDCSSFGFEEGTVVLDTSGIKVPTKKGEVCIIEHEEGAKTASLKFYYSNRNYSVDVIEGNYPNFRQLMPSKSSRAAELTGISFNPKFMNDIGKAAQLWSGNTSYATHIEFQGGNKPYVMFAEDGKREFFGLVMPVRGESHRLTQPSARVKSAKETQRELDDLQQMYDCQLEQSRKLAKEVSELKAQLAERDAAKEAIKDKVTIVDTNAEKFEKALIKAEKNNAEHVKTIRELDAKVAELEAALKEAETQEPAHEDDAELAAFLAEHAAIEVVAETKCATYLGGIEKNSPEMAAVKAAGARFGNHKKYGKCWYFPK